MTAAFFYTIGNTSALSKDHEKMFESAMSPSWSRSSKSYGLEPSKSTSSVKRAASKLKSIFH